MASQRPLLVSLPDSETSPSSVASPPVPGGFSCLCPNPSFQSGPYASGFAFRKQEAPPAFELLSFPPSDDPSPAFVLPPSAKPGAGVNSSFRLSRFGDEPRISISSSKSEPSPAVFSSDNWFRRARSRSAHEPRMLQSGTGDELRLSSLRLGAASWAELPAPTLELSEVRLTPEIFSKKGSDSIESAVPATGEGHDSQPSYELQSGSIHGSGRRDTDNRAVYIDNPEQTNERYEYSGNMVRTSKYSLLTFLPRNLFEQFHRVAYIYFLVIVGLNQIPQLAVFGRTASLFPLLFVLIVTAIKDGYEDWRRYRSDRKENNRLAQVLQQGEYREKNWKHIQVGEIVKVRANETIPCDMVLLNTSDANGVAFVQTINLDGESNLKTRYALQETVDKHQENAMVSGKVICEKPDRNIYGFTAYMEFDNRQLPLGPTNIVLRGCELKNTSWAVGVVVYAGHETKAMLNSSGFQSKRSRLEQIMNRETLWLSLFLFIICFVGGLGMLFWLKRHKQQLNALPYYGKKYLSTGDDYNYYGEFGEAFFTFLSFVIMFQIMIPISLYISMELVRLGQSFFMIRDTEMFHSGSNSRFQCRTLSINEDLGQIKYIFSDKTGTLTENKMEFRSASIWGVNYSNPKATFEHAEALRKQEWKPKVGVKIDPKLLWVLQGSQNSSERKAVHDYLLTLAACNTVVPSKVKNPPSGKLEMEVAQAADEGAGFVEYQGESPDEQALVLAAASYGYTLLERTSNHVVIDVLGEIQQFQVLGIHEFESVRKCMSVILQCPDKTVKVLVKGADSSVLSKITPMVGGNQGASDMEDTQQADLSTTCAHLDQYANEGLRTLAVAVRDLRGAEFEEWRSQYAKASTTLVDRAGMLREAAKVVERDLRLLGATGIEDKLQDGVPEAIFALREAGMKVWVLTGDKQETAISIGLSCALLTRDMKQIVINESEKESCREALVNAKVAHGIMTERRRSFLRRQNSVDVTYGENIQDSTISSEFFSASQPQAEFSTFLSKPMVDTSVSINSRTSQRWATRKGTGYPLALIIDGNSLVHSLEDDLEQELFDLAIACKVVICCRVAPLQKAGIVSLVKRKSRDLTLAIGDGANDVSMIQMADVGVGISGQEGRQAVMASDFAMGQFRFLKRLLLIHGHWNYSRLGYMVLYNFYRNAVFVMMLFWYILHTAFSPVSAISDWSLVFYSLIYTSVPTIIVGILDKDVSNNTLLKYPGLYGVGQRGESYNATLFWLTMLDTLWQSLVLFYVPFWNYRNSTMDIWSMGSIWTISVVILVIVHLAMDTQHWTWISHAAIWGSIAATFAFLFVLDSLKAEDFLPQYWVVFHVVWTASYWFDILLIVCLALLPRFCVKVIKQHFLPSDIQIARESEMLRRKAPHQNNVDVSSGAA